MTEQKWIESHENKPIKNRNRRGGPGPTTSWWTQPTTAIAAATSDRPRICFKIGVIKQLDKDAPWLEWITTQMNGWIDVWPSARRWANSIADVHPGLLSTTQHGYLQIPTHDCAYFLMQEGLASGDSPGLDVPSLSLKFRCDSDGDRDRFAQGYAEG